MVETGNLIDKRIIDVLIDPEKYLYERIRSKLIKDSTDASFEIKAAMIYWKVHNRLAEENGEQE